MLFLKKHIGVYLAVCAVTLALAIFLSRVGSLAVTAASSLQMPQYRVVMIDPGHGGEDGGAISCTGAKESGMNLEISLRLRDLLNLLGIHTKMIRTTDISVYTQGAQTIAEKKVSDIRNRVKMAEELPRGLLVSIHQNNFPDGRYRGAQVFYGSNLEGQDLAKLLQENIVAQIDSKNRRKTKPAKDIFLMEKVSCPAVLIECGFLSNVQEEGLLRSGEYQKKLAAVIGCSIQTYLEEEHEV